MCMCVCPLPAAFMCVCVCVCGRVCVCPLGSQGRRPVSHRGERPGPLLVGMETKERLRGQVGRALDSERSVMLVLVLGAWLKQTLRTKAQHELFIRDEGAEAFSEARGAATPGSCRWQC